MTITTQSFVAVNVGTAANDGTGDELRTAFIKLNSNFSNISTSGFNAGNILAAGNVQAAYYLGDGSQLTNISAANAYGNGNVATYLTVYNGVVSASNVFVAGNVTAQWLVGQANLTSLLTQDLAVSGMFYANSGTASTSTGTGALVVTGGLGVTGNITCGNLTVIGNITTVGTSSLTVSNNFIFLSNNNISNALDIGFVGQYAVGQGNVYTGLAYRATDGIYRLFSNLNPIPSSTINMANVTPASLALGNILAANIIGTIITPAQEYITSVGNLANLRSSGNITTTGYFFGNGSQLAGLVSYSNVYVTTYLPTYSGSLGNITASNLAGATITTIYSNIAVSNSSLRNYVDGQITAANSAITAANLGIIGYIDNQVSSANVAWQSNASAQQTLIYNLQANAATQSDLIIGINANVTQANLGMKGYVDQQVIAAGTYGNANVQTYLSAVSGNIIPSANVTYSLGNVAYQWKDLYVSSNTIYIGGTALTISSGNLTVGGNVVSGAVSGRANLSITTSSMADGANVTANIAGFKSYALFKITTSAAAWVTVYTDNASRSSDTISGRTETQDPLPGSGVIAEVITTGANAIVMSPATIGFNNEATPTTNIPIRVKNKSGGSATITVTLTLLQMES
jgi:hypothetical protein